MNSGACGRKAVRGARPGIPASKAMAEKRKLQRFSLNFAAMLEPMNIRGGATITGIQTANISAGGAYFNSRERLPRGSRVRLTLVMTLAVSPPGGSADATRMALDLKGRVVRVSATGVAVAFDEAYSIHVLDMLKGRRNMPERTAEHAEDGGEVP